jgi:hypothetical protein
MQNPEMQWAKTILQELTHRSLKQDNQWFLAPVDTVALNIPHYHQIIARPMDFGTIKKRLARDNYMNLEQVNEEVQLVFSNCFTFNPPESVPFQAAQRLKRIFDDKWSHKPDFSTWVPPVTNAGSFANRARVEPIRTNSYASASSFASPLAHTAPDESDYSDSEDERLGSTFILLELTLGRTNQKHDCCIGTN